MKSVNVFRLCRYLPFSYLQRNVAHRQFAAPQNEKQSSSVPQSLQASGDMKKVVDGTESQDI